MNNVSKQVKNSLRNEKDNADLLALRAQVDEARRAGNRRLPPEVELADLMGVTRGRLRGLLKKLEMEGIIWRQVGKGTFVGERSLTPQIGSLSDRVSSPEAFEARLLLEPHLASLAALHATNVQVEEMWDFISRLETIDDFEIWAVWDEKLHRQIARAARNTLLLALYDTVRECSPSGMRGRLNAVFSAKPRETTNIQHRACVEAIAAGDPERAASAMRAHLISVRDSLFGDM